MAWMPYEIEPLVSWNRSREPGQIECRARHHRQHVAVARIHDDDGPRGITERALRLTREYAAKEGLKNVTVIEGAAASTNLPPACCDAMFMRDVYHHITDVPAFTKSLFVSLKPGGRLAIMDFRPSPGSKVFPGVPENRGGHGIPPNLVEDELKAAGFTHLETIESWPGDEKTVMFLVLFSKPR